LETGETAESRGAKQQLYNPFESNNAVAKAEPTEVTQLLVFWSSGDRAALDKVVPLIYRELRKVAGAYLRRERPDHTLQPTALVHEVYLRLVNQTQIDCQTRAHFLGIAANLMRQILVNYSDRHRAAKRGGGIKVQLEPAPPSSFNRRRSI